MFKMTGSQMTGLYFGIMLAILGLSGVIVSVLNLIDTGFDLGESIMFFISLALLLLGAIYVLVSLSVIIII